MLNLIFTIFLGVISKLGLIFPGTRKFRRYGEVNFDYSLLVFI